MTDAYRNRYPKMPSMPKVGGAPRPPRVRRPPAMPRGPRWFQRITDAERVAGFGDPPPGFVIGTTSAPEWVLYAAIAAVTGLPKNPRQPPYQGGPPRWWYQSYVEGGRRQLGGSVPDFVIDNNGELVIIRLQSHRFHVVAPVETHAYDLLQKMRLSRVGGRSTRVVDVYESDFSRKDPGQMAKAAVLLVKRALAGAEALNPIIGGTAPRRVPA